MSVFVIKNSLAVLPKNQAKSKPKRKLDPKIIRVGDQIQITNCMFFVRCGYPLCVKDLTESIMSRSKIDVFNLIKKEIYPNLDINELSIKDFSNNRISSAVQLDYSIERVCKTIASIKIKVDKWGGNRREIYEKSIPDLKNEYFNVKEVKFVKTGERYQGSGYTVDYFGGEDYDPTYLDVDKTYKILTLDYIDLAQREKLEYLNLEENDLRIQALNVLKV